MKKLKLIARFRALPIKTRQLLSLGMILALVVALPLFIWAIVTQRFDIRKRATTGEPVVTGEPPQEYSLQPLPSADIVTNVPKQNEGYAVQALLSDQGGVITNQTDYSYAWSINDPSIANITPFNACTYNIQPPCPEDHLSIQATSLGNTTIQVDVTQISSQEIVASTVFNLTVNPRDLVMKFKIKFAGVADDLADGAKAKIRFVKDGVDLETSPIIFSHAGDGVYEASITLGSSLPKGSGYTIYVKGEKHLARKFCVPAGQSERCVGNGRIVIPSPVFDFTGLELEPGDLYPQDGKADSEDFAKIISLLSKLCSDLTEQDKFVADLDYNGCINIRDAFLMRKTLETKYDE